jgi:U3 small nucleolar RNA-associated protein 14
MHGGLINFIFSTLQKVENYEYELPSDFEDEEIDDEEAFNSEDERMYGHLFKNKKDDGGSASEDEEVESESEEDDLLNSDDDDEEVNEDSEDDEEEEEEEDSELEEVFAKAGAAGGGDSPTFFGSDEEAEEEGDDDDDDYETKEAKREAMVRAVTDGAVSGEGGRATRGRRKKEIVVTEAYPESEFNLPAAG